jgi:hypothetical protein
LRAESRTHFLNQKPSRTIHSGKDQSCALGYQKEQSMKHNYKLSVAKSHSLVGLPLFERDWRQSKPRHPTTSAGQHLVRRFGACPSIADVIADLAGLGLRQTSR